jgi:hypothetical protein
VALHICFESLDFHFADLVWLDTPAYCTSVYTETSEMLPHEPGVIYTIYQMTASHTLSIRFPYSASLNHPTILKSPLSEYPNNIRAAESTTKWYSNNGVLYKNSGSSIIHTGIYDMFRPKACIQVIIRKFFRMKIKLWKIRYLKVNFVWSEI